MQDFGGLPFLSANLEYLFPSVLDCPLSSPLIITKIHQSQCIIADKTQKALLSLVSGLLMQNAHPHREARDSSVAGSATRPLAATLMLPLPAKCASGQHLLAAFPTGFPPAPACSS